MPGAWVGGAIAAAGAVGSAAISASASGSAANIGADASTAAAQVQKDIFRQTQANLSPYMGAGTNALAAMQYGLGIGPGSSSPNLLESGSVYDSYQVNGQRFDVPVGTQLAQDWKSTPGLVNLAPMPGFNVGGGVGGGMDAGGLTRQFTAADFTASPGYAFQKQQGMEAIQNAASMGGGIGGNALKELESFGTGLAGQDWWNAYNAFTQRQNDTFNKLSGVAGLGENAAAGVGNAGAQAATGIGNALTGAANARAAGVVGQANALSGGINNASQLGFLYAMMRGQSGGGGITPSGGNSPWTPGNQWTPAMAVEV